MPVGTGTVLHTAEGRAESGQYIVIQYMVEDVTYSIV